MLFESVISIICVIVLQLMVVLIMNSIYFQENKNSMLLPTQERISSNNYMGVQQKSRKRTAVDVASNKNSTGSSPNIRHNKQRRGRGKGRGRGRGKGKGKHRNKSKSKDPSSQHSHTRRTMEKEVLVQNRTLELLGGGGARILWANRVGNGTSDSSVKPHLNGSTSSVNLFSSKKNSSTSGILVGLLIRNNTFSNSSAETNERTSGPKLKLEGVEVVSRGNLTENESVHVNNTKRRGGYPLKIGRGGDFVVTDYQYDYDTIETPGLVESAVWFNSGQARRNDGAIEDERSTPTGGINTAGKQPQFERWPPLSLFPIPQVNRKSYTSR